MRICTEEDFKKVDAEKIFKNEKVKNSLLCPEDVSKLKMKSVVASNDDSDFNSLNEFEVTDNFELLVTSCAGFEHPADKPEENWRNINGCNNFEDM
jgi:hypothetical protein